MESGISARAPLHYERVSGPSGKSEMPRVAGRVIPSFRDTIVDAFKLPCFSFNITVPCNSALEASVFRDNLDLRVNVTPVKFTSQIQRLLQALVPFSWRSIGPDRLSNRAAFAHGLAPLCSLLWTSGRL